MLQLSRPLQGWEGLGWYMGGFGSKFICLTDQLSLEHCHLCVQSTVTGHSHTDIVTPVTMMSLKCAA